jgi:hypothetical protein
VSKDQAERCSQFMAGDGDEIRFHPVDAHQFGVGVLKPRQEAGVLDGDRRLCGQSL